MVDSVDTVVGAAVDTLVGVVVVAITVVVDITVVDLLQVALVVVTEVAVGVQVLEDIVRVSSPVGFDKNLYFNQYIVYLFIMALYRDTSPKYFSITAIATKINT